MVHEVVERARAQGILYQLQYVSRLANEPAHQPELGIVLVGQHELTMLPDKGIKRLERALPVNDVLRPLDSR